MLSSRTTRGVEESPSPPGQTSRDGKRSTSL
jgi:hypothetical protein